MTAKVFAIFVYLHGRSNFLYFVEFSSLEITIKKLHLKKIPFTNHNGSHKNKLGGSKAKLLTGMIGNSFFFFLTGYRTKKGS